MGTSVSAILTVTTAALGTAPGQATGLAISNLGATSLTFSWVAPGVGTPPLQYQPQQALAGSSPTWTNIGSSGVATTVSVTGLTAATGYLFQVVTTNASGSSASAPLAATTLSIVPTAATGLASVGTPGATDVSLSWVAPGVGTPPLSYQAFYRTPSGTGSFTPFPTTTNALALDVTGLTPGSVYDFEIAASNAAGTGPFSAVLSGIATAAGGGTAPGAATGLTVSAIAPTTLTLTWAAPSVGTPPLSYQPQETPSGSTVWVNIGAPISGTTVAVTGLTANTAYQFIVVTTNASGSSTSATVAATTLSVVPTAPTNLSVVGTPTQTSVALQWVAPVMGTTPLTYQVSYRTPSGSGTFTALATTTTTLTQTISGLIAGSTYDFEVNAANAAGTSAQSTILAGISTAAASGAPSAATGLAVSSLAATSLTLNWVAPGSGALPFSYQPQQAPAGSSTWVNVGGSITTTTLAVTGLVPNTAYQYQIITTNSVGSSTSAAVSATTLSVLPGAPTGLTVVGTSTQTSIVLSWVAPSAGTPTLTYQVNSRTPSGSGTFAAAGATTTALTQTISGLTAGTGYDFEVSAFNAAGTGPFSTVLVNAQTAPIQASVLPSAPTNLTAATITANSIQVSWTAPAVGTPPLTYVVSYQPIAQSESAEGTAITTVGPLIYASRTIGSASAGPFDTFALNSAGQVVRNGVADTTTSTVIELYYHQHDTYQENAAGGWWSWTGTTWLATSSPIVTITTIGVSPASFVVTAAAGTVVGAISVVLSSGTFTGTLALTGGAAADFLVSGSNLLLAAVEPVGTYTFNIVATQAGIVNSPFTQALTIAGVSVAESLDGTYITTAGGPAIIASNTPGTPGTANSIVFTSGGQVAVNGAVIAATGGVIGLYKIGHTVFQQAGAWYGPVVAGNGGVSVNPPGPTVALSNLTLANGAAQGTVIGAISTAVGAGVYTFTYSLTGANTGGFAISGNNLISGSASLTSGSSYPVTISAASVSILGSPFTATFSIAYGAVASLAPPQASGTDVAGNVFNYTTMVGGVTSWNQNSISYDYSGNTKAPFYGFDGTIAANQWSIDGSGIITFTGDSNNHGGGIQTVASYSQCALSTPTNHAANNGFGIAYNYGYMEARMAWTPSGVSVYGADFPAWWGTSVEGATGQPGNHLEYDVVEAGTAGGPNNDLHPGGLYWVTSGGTVQPSVVFNYKDNMSPGQQYLVGSPIYPPVGGAFNSYALLWTPGMMQAFFNNVGGPIINTTVAQSFTSDEGGGYYGTYVPNVLGNLANQHLFWILGCAEYGWPVAVEYVHIFQ